MDDDPVFFFSLIHLTSFTQREIREVFAKQLARPWTYADSHEGSVPWSVRFAYLLVRDTCEEELLRYLEQLIFISRRESECISSRRKFTWRRFSSCMDQLCFLNSWRKICPDDAVVGDHVLFDLVRSIRSSRDVDRRCMFECCGDVDQSCPCLYLYHEKTKRETSFTSCLKPSERRDR